MGSGEIQGELWGRHARAWADQEARHSPLFEAMLDAVGAGEGLSLLDAGCGAGGAARLAVDRGSDVHGLDASEGLIDIARTEVPEAEFRVGDFESLPYADSAFDAVIAPNSIQYAESPAGAVAELKRVTARGGKIALGLFDRPEHVDYRVVIFATIRALPDDPRRKDPFGMSRAGVLEGLLTGAGLDVTDEGSASCPFDYESFEDLWRIHESAGPTQAALGVVGESALRASVADAVTPFTRQDGSLHFDNSFRWVVGMAPA